MRIFSKLAMVVTVATIIVGCAPTIQFVPFPDQMKQIEDPDKARIYVVRPTTFGGFISMKINDGEKLIGKTGPNGYLCWEREPGRMLLVGKSENTDKFPLMVEKGISYYIQQHVRMGLVIARNKLSLLTEEDGKAKVSKCKPPKVRQ